MVIGAFPVLKLGILAIKQVSKPIANVIKVHAKGHPFFRHYVCMPPAQLYNWIEVKTKMWALNLGRPVQVPPLNEAMAIELGANLLGECIIFVIGAAALIVEYNRQLKKEAKKEENSKLEKAEITNRMAELSFRIERQDAQIREMSRVVSELESRSLFRWTKERLGDYHPFDPENPDQTSTSYRQKSSEGSRIKRALNYLETEVFKSKSIEEPSQATAEALQQPLRESMEDYDSITINAQRKIRQQ
uniref:OPA3-like protein CG13603 n=1 Tax=Glossina brevipalpis TaxID=37001 RepID=A0A1A9WU75_9MUSC